VSRRQNGAPGWRAETEDAPVDAAQSEAQIRAVLARLGPPPKRVLDLGCGGGRLLVPLAAAGHDIAGIDRAPEAVARCRLRLEESAARAALQTLDFLTRPICLGGPFDAVLCLGNTLMTVADIDDAVELLTAVRRSLCDGGQFVIDDLPGEFWPELAEGNWQSGVSETGDLQLIWQARDAVFVLRRGEAVDPTCPRPRLGEPRLRLWTDGALRLAARLAGLSGPHRPPRVHLLVMRRETGAHHGE